jgi:1-deoxy-D-xylulose-5-phosphate reductoisomerase
MKNISILGSTGSIGKNVLDVVRSYPGRFRVVGLAAGKNIELLHAQAEAFQPLLISVADQNSAQELCRQMSDKWQKRIVYGSEGVEKIATIASADLVVSAIVGAAGLPPTMAAIEAGKDIALANKETLVIAGEIIMAAVSAHKVNLLPIDSEHNAIFQSLSAGRKHDVKKIILTASGGPFRDYDENRFWEVTPEQALSHPNWQMGKKISIDSATLMNKGLEVIEAKWLFGLDLQKIEVLIHPQSIVHSMVEYIDGSIISQMGIPDMRIPIAYALTYPERIKLDLPFLDLTRYKNIQFFPPDFQRFPSLKLAYYACKIGGTMPAVLNAANEIAVDAFLNRRIRYPEIALTVAETLNRIPAKHSVVLEDILNADLHARIQAESVVEALAFGYAQKRGDALPVIDLPPGNSSFS